MKCLRPTRLPSTLARVALVSGEYPQLRDALIQIGVEPVQTTQDMRLPPPISWHPDTQTGVVGEMFFILRKSSLIEQLDKLGIHHTETEQEPGKTYPQDAVCNVLSWGKYVLGNPQVSDRKILLSAEQHHLEWISVKQGYAACSVALVTDKAAITADLGVAAQLEQYGIEVLRISPGHILLPGYRTGFIGGCSGKLAPDQLLFAGQLRFHPEGEAIRAFLMAHGVEAVELFDGKLIDVGGILAFC